MASSKFVLLASVLLVVTPLMAANEAYDIPPLPSWIIDDDDVCKEVECGKGDCIAASDPPFNYKCQCKPGWKRTRFEHEDDLQFLPCIIPNCSIKYSCMPVAPPAPLPPHNSSFFDPCYWIYCGEGSCTKNSTYRHTCQCNHGHRNLLDIDAFPCYSSCAISSDCEKLGIHVSKASVSSKDPTPINQEEENINQEKDDTNQATSCLPRELHSLSIFLMISMAVAILK